MKGRVTEEEEGGRKLVGFFSKEKKWDTNSLACFCIFPQYMGKGYGKFLISLSYELAKIEGRFGGPERPLSDLGRVSYISFWTECCLKAINHFVLAHQIKLGLIPQVTASDLANIIEPNPSQPQQQQQPLNPQNHPLILSTHRSPINSEGGQLHGVYYTDLAGSCAAILNCPDEILDQLEISIKDLSRLTWIFENDIVDALQERQVLQFSNKHQIWCLNWTKIKEILIKARDNKAAKELRLQQMPPEKRAMQSSVRNAIPAQIRWRPFWLPPPIVPVNPTPPPVETLIPTTSRRNSTGARDIRPSIVDEYAALPSAHRNHPSHPTNLPTRRSTAAAAGGTIMPGAGATAALLTPSANTTTRSGRQVPVAGNATVIARTPTGTTNSRTNTQTNNNNTGATAPPVLAPSASASSRRTRSGHGH
jgi:hypothetical protein